MKEKKKKKSPTARPHSRSSTRILIGLIFGVIIGFILNQWPEFSPSSLFIRGWILDYFLQPIGDVFLRGLFMVVVPLVFCSLIVGVCRLGSIGHLKRLGVRLIIFYVITSIVAILIGQTLISLIRPGDGLHKKDIEIAHSHFKEQVSDLEPKSKAVYKSLWPGIIKTIVPKNIIEQMAENNMLAVIFISILLGVAFLGMKKENTKEIVSSFQTLSHAFIKIVGWIMFFAPYAVAALVALAVTHFGLDVMKKNVSKYVLVVFLGYFIHFFFTYSIINKLFIKIPIREFYKRLGPVIATAFSTSSSSATMPINMRTLENRFGIPESITKFSIPLGMTINMDGTALFEVIAALFIAQVSGIDISLSGQVTLVVLVLLTSIGVAGVPGGSIPILMSAMASLNIPPEGIALVLGIDRLLDMGRTVVNVMGDAIGTLYLARIEKVPIDTYIKKTKDT